MAPFSFTIPHDSGSPMWMPVLIMFAAMSFIPMGDAAGKLLTNAQGTSVAFVAWSRFVIGAVLVLPFAPKGSLALLKDWRVVLRALLLMGGITSITLALQTAPISDAFAAFFIGPSVSYILAVIFLREPLTWARSGLVALGFAGMLIVLRPVGGVAPGMGAALMAGCFYGAFLTASRWLSDLPPRALLLTQLTVPAIVLTPFGWATLPMITIQIGWLAFLSALFSMLGNFLLLYAYRLAPATALAPLVYFQLVAATALGWFIFGTFPDGWTMTGLALILLSGLSTALIPPVTSRTNSG